MLSYEVKHKRLDRIEGLEGFGEYAIDVEGNVFSFKYNKLRKLKPGWSKRRDGYLFVKLCDNKGNTRNFYVHRLVALAFLPPGKLDQEIKHKDGNLQNNRIENIEWISKSKNRKINENNDIHLETELSDLIKKVHMLSAKKGLSVPDTQTFTNFIIKNALEQYVNQYGLRRMMM
jgi:hypothetical protein